MKVKVALREAGSTDKVYEEESKCLFNPQLQMQQ